MCAGKDVKSDLEIHQLISNAANNVRNQLDISFDEWVNIHARIHPDASKLVRSALLSHLQSSDDHRFDELFSSVVPLGRFSDLCWELLSSYRNNEKVTAGTGDGV